MAEVQDQKLRWKKTGGGSHTLHRRDGSKKRIKPGETFKAYPDEIPEAFRDIIVPVDKIPEEPPLDAVTEFEVKEVDDDSPLEGVTGLDELERIAAEQNGTEIDVSHLDLEPRPKSHEKLENGTELVLSDPKPGGWYDVINKATGKAMNETSLRLSDAEELLKSLSDG